MQTDQVTKVIASILDNTRLDGGHSVKGGDISSVVAAPIDTKITAGFMWQAHEAFAQKLAGGVAPPPTGGSCGIRAGIVSGSVVPAVPSIAAVPAAPPALAAAVEVANNIAGGAQPVTGGKRKLPPQLVLARDRMKPLREKYMAQFRAQYPNMKGNELLKMALREAGKEYRALYK